MMTGIRPDTVIFSDFRLICVHSSVCIASLSFSGSVYWRWSSAMI
jgi:hypothetical protein